MLVAGKQPENLEAYMNLGGKDIVRLVLMLLIEEGLKERLAEFREQQDKEVSDN